MDIKIRKDIHIEILKYAHEHNEFICEELLNDLKFNQNERHLFLNNLVYNKTLLQNTGRNRKTNKGEESIFMISTEGRFKLLEFEQLDNAKETSVIAIKKTTTSIRIAYVAVFFNIIALIIALSTLCKTQQSLELSTSPEVSIIPIDSGLDEDRLRQPGHSQISNSKADFTLKNNFLGDLKDIDIKMIILEMHKDSKSKNLVICPYSYVDFTENPDFIVRKNRLVSNISKNKFYNLKSLEEIEFSIDYRNLGNAGDLDFFIKIDVDYKRMVDNKPFSLTKIFKTYNLHHVENDKETKEEYVVDTDIDKEMIRFINLNNRVLNENNFGYPFFTEYPFRDSDFVKTLKSSFPPPYLVEQSECRLLELDAKNKMIKY